MSITFQVQDTLPKIDVLLTTPKANELGNTIEIGRQTMELVSVRTFQVDSSRMDLAKRPVPVIKTIPYIPQNDTILHPSYNVFDNSFYFPLAESRFDDFSIVPLEPELIGLFTSKNQVESSDNSISIEMKAPVIEKPVLAQKTNVRKGFESTDWMLGVIIFSLILFGWIRVGFGRFVQLAIQASYNFFTARRIKEESNVMRSRVFHFMNLLFFINLGLFLSQWVDFQNIALFELNGFLLFILIFMVILLFYSLKGLVLTFLDFLFLSKGAFTYYNSTVFIYNRMVGLLLLPLISVLPFVDISITPWLFYLGFLIIALLYFFRISRGIQIGSKIRLSIFYLILYLCALEILPLLIIYKLVEPYV